MTQKLSCPLTRQEADALINGIPLRPENHHPLLRKLILKQNTQLFHPVVIVEYDRIPYVYREGGVRVTFDRNLASSSCTGDFFRETVPKRPVMPAGMLLMEVKFNEFLTDPIYRALNTGTLQQTAFSKYYLCRKYDNRGI